MIKKLMFLLFNISLIRASIDSILKSDSKLLIQKVESIFQNANEPKQSSESGALDLGLDLDFLNSEPFAKSQKIKQFSV